MVKLCKVIKNNPATTVIKFDAVEVQMPAIGRDAKQVWVAHENGKYFVVDEKYAEYARRREETAQVRKRTIKKTTENDELASEKEDVQDEAE